MGSSVTRVQSHEAKLNLDVLRSQLAPKQQHMITAETVAELDKFSADPDYGEEFLDSYRDHLNILGENPKYTSRGYMSAVKFFTLIEAGHKITNAYIMVFPERLAARTKRSQGKKDIRGEASRYNQTSLVNEIRKVATFPVHVIHRHLLHEAILVQAKLMKGAKSEFVRQKAGEVLIRELKPAEDAVLQVEINDGSKSAIAALHDAAEMLAARELQSAKAGVPLKEIIEGKISRDDNETIIEAEDIQELQDEAEKATDEWTF